MKRVAVLLTAGLAGLFVFICFKVYKNEQTRDHEVDNEYRESLVAQTLADSDTVTVVQSQMRAGTMDITNGILIVSNLQARELRMQQRTAEFDRTNK